MTFDVEASLPDKCEVGSDSWSVDGKTPKTHLCGIEVKDSSYAGRILKADEIPKALSVVDEKMAPLLKEFGYRGNYSTEVRVGKDGVPYMIDFCFSDDTEVLTKDGWKLFRDCKQQDQLTTLNVKTGDIEYQHPSQFITLPYKGKMVNITNRRKTIECMVTPNHDVLRTDRFKKKIFKQKACILDDKGYIPRCGKWNQFGDEYFILPEHHHEWDFYGQYGHKICRRVHHDDAKKIPMIHWSAFMAWYLSEGSCGGTGHINISQTKHVKIIQEVLEKLPFNWVYNGKDFQISSTQIQRYLKPMGLCDKKRVPDYIKSASREVIVEFLKHYALGDGSRTTRFHKRLNKVYDRGVRYYTTSKGMADDLQELILKIGSVANIYRRKTRGTWTVGLKRKQYKRNHDIYIVAESQRYQDFWFETAKARRSQFIQESDYNGRVYCATVPNGTLYVRRNGKPFWSGNCARLPNPPGFLQTLMLKNYSEIIWQGANGECVEPEYDHAFGVQLQIKSTWSDQEHWQPIDFDAKYRDQVKIVNPCKINGRHYCVPLRFGIAECGAVVGTGDSIDAAVKMAKKAADTIEGYMLKVDCNVMDDAIEACEGAKAMGTDLKIC